VTPFAWLIGLILPACGADGTAGLPAPMEPMDMTRIERPASPNTFLAGPEGMKPTPDFVTRRQNLPASVLYEKARVLFSGQPRTYVAAEFPDQRQVHYVVRSAIMNFPDLVTVEVDPAGADRSTVVVWSRSVYGRSDFGVNRKRTEQWLTALRQSTER
jgi:uncharacterized protein (DUF1499 family)